MWPEFNPDKDVDMSDQYPGNEWRITQTECKRRTNSDRNRNFDFKLLIEPVADISVQKRAKPKGPKKWDWCDEPECDEEDCYLRHKGQASDECPSEPDS